MKWKRLQDLVPGELWLAPLTTSVTLRVGGAPPSDARKMWDVLAMNVALYPCVTTNTAALVLVVAVAAEAEARLERYSSRMGKDLLVYEGEHTVVRRRATVVGRAFVGDILLEERVDE